MESFFIAAFIGTAAVGIVMDSFVAVSLVVLSATSFFMFALQAFEWHVNIKMSFYGVWFGAIVALLETWFHESEDDFVNKPQTYQRQSLYSKWQAQQLFSHPEGDFLDLVIRSPPAKTMYVSNSGSYQAYRLLFVLHKKLLHYASGQTLRPSTLMINSFAMMFESCNVASKDDQIEREHMLLAFLDIICCYKLVVLAAKPRKYISVLRDLSKVQKQMRDVDVLLTAQSLNNAISVLT